MKKFLKGIWLFFRYGPAKISERWEQAIFDGLTGLYNCRFFHEVGERELARAEREIWQGRSYPISFIYIDVKKLKEINDCEGHGSGDEALRRVAVLLKKICQREIDVVARVGGDEFAILLPETKKKGAMVVVDKIRTAANELFSPGGRPIGLDCGVAESEGASLEELISRADEEMYKVKKGSKS